jgi:hypothetical protein
VVAWIIHFVIAYGLWFLYVGHLAADEAGFAAAGAAVTASASKIVFEKHVAPMRAQWRAVAQAWRLPKYMLVGAWEILAVLARQVFRGEAAESLLFSVPFDAGGDDDESAFRRALAISYTCSTPNFVIIGIDREHQRLVYHQIKRSEVPRMTKNLGAKE